jgi:hypothetical protein
MMIGNRIALYSIALGVLALAVTGCTDEETTNPPSETTAYGTTTTVAGGNVRSFLKTDANGNPTAIGLRISAATINGVPMVAPANPSDYMYQIPVPAEALTKTPVQDISLDWGPYGHPPAHVYDTAHFDMHFYTVPRSERMTWSGQGADSARLQKMPDASVVPPGHVTDSMGIPFMGMHFLDINSHELHGQPFSSTFIWGYYNGVNAFIEPMITRWFLQSKQSYSAAIPQPTTYSKTGVYWPTQYSVSYDSTTNEHVITMSGMVLR